MTTQKIGLLIANLGTPDEPTTDAVKRYLKQFLNDARVIDLPKWRWQPLLNTIILPRRSPKVAKLYQAIWTENGSPLLAISRQQQQALQTYFDETEQNVIVELGMTYGNPSMASATDRLIRAGVSKIIILPLYPQYSSTTTASVFDAFAKGLLQQRGIVPFEFIHHYHNDPLYIQALAETITLAEDEKDLADALEAMLKHNNYSVDVVNNGQDALDYLMLDDYDGAILDVMMPQMDGVTVVRKLRENKKSTPVLLLTAKSEIEDKVYGLDSGADDYMTKPFVTRELLARVRSMTRRQATFTSNVLELGNVSLSKHTFELSTEKDKVRLSNKEYQMMEMLMRNPGNVIQTEQFLERIWGYDSDSEINVVWVNISYLRKKLKALDANVHIKATRNVGYTLEMSDV